MTTGALGALHAMTAPRRSLTVGAGADEEGEEGGDGSLAFALVVTQKGKVLVCCSCAILSTRDDDRGAEQVAESRVCARTCCIYASIRQTVLDEL